jgi:hypothetical protein
MRFSLSATIGLGVQPVRQSEVYAISGPPYAEAWGYVNEAP